jgi:hypothetical protein
VYRRLIWSEATDSQTGGYICMSCGWMNHELHGGDGEDEGSNHHEYSQDLDE